MLLRPALTALMLAAAGAALLPGGPAAAQNVAERAVNGAATIFGGMKADTKSPVEVTSDRLSVNQADGTATFGGNVVISQGEMRLKAADVTVVYAGNDRRRISKLRATGGVTLVNGPDAAEAREASYDVEAGTVTLTGDVLLSQGDNVLSGQTMVVNLADGTASVEGRVRSVLQPGSN
ncbi:lipopolysaccharide transport periplasmic protein LptA [Paracoccus suum]|uniref:Lipopolysaccharide transport periplasmic protein LptA n=1 Tax=Paracoccus suum TaxID=2259340 RepID=A0A344PIF4_9RHOB|nr:lipopolysaccharide transport periplasmic protein LptA [Paracoccus suum]AXC49159.1 lipopolysaccharide transport periplasmic protein LptA [Paracoccus suum]